MCVCIVYTYSSCIYCLYIYIVYLLSIYCLYIVYILSIYCLYIVYILSIYCLYIVYILSIYYIVHISSMYVYVSIVFNYVQLYTVSARAHIFVFHVASIPRCCSWSILLQEAAYSTANVQNSPALVTSNMMPHRAMSSELCEAVWLALLSALPCSPVLCLPCLLCLPCVFSSSQGSCAWASNSVEDVEVSRWILSHHANDNSVPGVIIWYNMILMMQDYVLRCSSKACLFEVIVFPLRCQLDGSTWTTAEKQNQHWGDLEHGWTNRTRHDKTFDKTTCLKNPP